ncbi:MAG: DUF285 domain-containing protein [Spirochaetales bacterium]|nr:DUF285 domain-containing protein [Spirochaetales bacterium]
MFIKRKTVLVLMSGFIFLAALLSCQMPGAGDTVSAVEFITTWKTTSDNETITIPTYEGNTYDYTVDWGDGSSEPIIEDTSPEHEYTTAGTYTVKISGTFPRIYFGGVGTDKDKILSIENWGTIVWESMVSAFYNCSNLTCNAADAPDLSNVINMNSMFNYAETFNGDLSSWDVSNVMSMNNMFSCAAVFNGDLSSWDVSNVTNMSLMFDEAAAFNGDISSWNVSSVTDMDGMFYGAAAFTNHDLSGWTLHDPEPTHAGFSDGWGTGNTRPSDWISPD